MALQTTTQKLPQRTRSISARGRMVSSVTLESRAYDLRARMKSFLRWSLKCRRSALDLIARAPHSTIEVANLGSFLPPMAARPTFFDFPSPGSPHACESAILNSAASSPLIAGASQYQDPDTLPSLPIFQRQQLIQTLVPMDLKPIPAFYCCYLLRSINHHRKLYIGSTPNPSRRLAQHNGDIKGGAALTASKTWRRWEMTCVVSGFPSQIAALQFEWAWQNPHLTRHIVKADPKPPKPPKPTVVHQRDKAAESEKTGQRTNRPRRPILTLKGGLENLHALLRVPYFNTWPLSLRFFSEDIYREWQVRSGKSSAEISPRIKVRTDFGCSDEAWKESRKPGQVPILLPSLSERLKSLEINYDHMRPHLEKSQFLLDEDEETFCSICKQLLRIATDSIIVCSHGDCRSSSHMVCLAGRFLEQGNDSSKVIPMDGSCPECHKRLQWIDLVKEMTLRMYGEKEVKKVLRKRRVGVPQSDEDDGDEDLADITVADIAGEDIDLEDMDDAASVTSTASDMSEVRAAPTFRAPAPLPMLIEESDWENAEVVDCTQR